MVHTTITDDEDFDRIPPDEMNQSFNKDDVNQENNKEYHPELTETFTGTRT